MRAWLELQRLMKLAAVAICTAIMDEYVNLNMPIRPYLGRVG